MTAYRLSQANRPHYRTTGTTGVNSLPPRYKTDQHRNFADAADHMLRNESESCLLCNKQSTKIPRKINVSHAHRSHYRSSQWSQGHAVRPVQQHMILRTNSENHWSDPDLGVCLCYHSAIQMFTTQL